MSESEIDAPADIYLAYQPLVGPFEHLEQRLIALGADLPDLLRLHTVVCLHRPGSQVQALSHTARVPVCTLPIPRTWLSSSKIPKALLSNTVLQCFGLFAAVLSAVFTVPTCVHV